MDEDKIWKGVGDCKHSSKCEALHEKLKKENATSTDFYETCPFYIAVKNWFEKKGYLEKCSDSVVFPAALNYEVRFEDAGSGVSVHFHRFQPTNYCYCSIAGDLEKVKEKGRLGIVMRNIASELGDMAE